MWVKDKGMSSHDPQTPEDIVDHVAGGDIGGEANSEVPAPGQQLR
jgi:hypothetical protein